MDIDDGYILWTGIWKALGNSKADIVKMIDSQPDLAPLIRRVRGGYLKIQGTWMPYEVALKLSRRVAWTIRDDLIPLFGPTFPSTCLAPDQPGYGQVVPTGQKTRRVRRPLRTPIMEMPRAPTSWKVVTPSVNMVAPGNAPPYHPANARSSDYHMTSPSYSIHSQIRGSTPSDIRPSPITISGNPKSGSNVESHRFGGYNSYPLSAYRNTTPLPPPPPSSKAGLSLDTSSEPRLKEEFNLPPIQAPDSNSSSSSPYTLPPISSMEEIRNVALQDSAAVLRRLRMDDDGYNKAEERTWLRRHSVSVHSSSPRSTIDASSRFQPYNTSRSYQDQRGYSPAESNRSCQRIQTNDSVRAATRSNASQYSHEGDTTSNPSPTSPVTPSSTLSEYGTHYPHTKGYVNKYPPDRIGHQWSTTAHSDRHGLIMERPETISVRRNSSSDGDSSSQPHRPW